MPRVKLFKEEEVLQKAIQLFSMKGYHATSMQDLVDALGINRASLYDTFGSKEALFDRAFALYKRENRQRVLHFLAQQSSIKEGIFRLFDYAVDESVADKEAKGCLAVNTTTELIPGDQKICSQLSENKADFEKIFYDYLMSGIKKGEISPDKDAKALAAFLFTLYNGIKVVGKINPNKEELMASVKAGLAVLD
ncbi:TetR/AcrR family transcriptional regulator [Catalinimonas sp. 4WD22]|uniref:TetR/AcrR family transcriptional regulator n=1 Tax=Catalinimonas locisalis TaxID=3133978 RepID=UPI003100E615